MVTMSIKTHNSTLDGTQTSRKLGWTLTRITVTPYTKPSLSRTALLTELRPRSRDSHSADGLPPPTASCAHLSPNLGGVRGFGRGVASRLFAQKGRSEKSIKRSNDHTFKTYGLLKLLCLDWKVWETLRKHFSQLRIKPHAAYERGNRGYYPLLDLSLSNLDVCLRCKVGCDRMGEMRKRTKNRSRKLQQWAQANSQTSNRNKERHTGQTTQTTRGTGAHRIG